MARAGTTTPFHTGRTISTEQANYDGNYVYGSGREGAYRQQTTPVGSFEPNGFGVYDVHGNVWEWVEDCWNINYRRAPADGSAWLSGDCNRRVLRGGSLNLSPRSIRSALRFRYPADYRLPRGGPYDGQHRRLDIFHGFRVARTLTP